MLCVDGWCLFGFLVVVCDYGGVGCFNWLLQARYGFWIAFCLWSDC